MTTQGDEYFGSQGVVGNYEADESAAEADLIIQCDNVHKTYLLGVEGVPALRGVTMSIQVLCIREVQEKFKNFTQVFSQN